MPGRHARIPDDILPFKERLSPEEKERWVAEWRHVVWHSPRYLGIYGGVFLTGLLFFICFMPPWEIVETAATKCVFAAGELLASYVVAKWMAYGFSSHIMKERISKSLADDLRKNAQL